MKKILAIISIFAILLFPVETRAALEFDGNTDYVTLGSDNLDGTSAITVEAWINVDTFTTTRYVFVRVDTNAADQFYVGSDQAIHGDVHSPVGRWAIDGNTTLSADTWYHVAITYDASAAIANKMDIYINGVADSATSFEVTGGDGTLTANNEYISRNHSSAAMDGTIDMFRLWDTNLSQDQINNYMNQKRVAENEPNLQVQHIFDEGSGSSLIDTASGRSNGTITNATWNNNEHPPVSYGE